VCVDAVRNERERERGLVLCVNAKENMPERELNYLWYLSAIRQLLPSVTTDSKDYELRVFSALILMLYAL
jgi:hypothetical protein